MSKSLLKRQLESDQLEMNLIAKANDISWQAFDGERQPLRNTADNMINLGQVPFKEPKDIITREMIQDYQDNLENKPAYIGRDENEYKYFPSGIRFTAEMFEKPTFGNAAGLDRPATQEDIVRDEESKVGEVAKIVDTKRNIDAILITIKTKEEQINSTYTNLMDLIREHETLKENEKTAQSSTEAQETKVKEMEAKLTKLKEEFATHSASMTSRLKRAKIGEIRKDTHEYEIQEKKRKELIVALKKIRQTLIALEGKLTTTKGVFEVSKAELETLKIQLTELEKAYEALLKRVDEIDTMKDNYVKNIDENKVEASRVKRENKNLLYKYEEALLHANRNKLSIQQDIGESDTDYLQRLNAIEATKFDSDLYRDKVDLVQVKLLKENLQYITKDESVIENIIKSFSPEGKFKINKNFTAIKKILLDTFGYNNRNLLSSDVVDAIEQYFYKLENPFDDKVIEEEPMIASAVPAEIDEEDIKLRIEDNSLLIYSKTHNKPLYFKIGRGHGREYVLFSKTENKKNCFKNIQGRGNNTLKNLFFDYLKLTDKNLLTIFGETKVKYIKDLYELLKTKYELHEVNANVKRSYGHTEVGYGLNLTGKSETDSLKERLQILEGEIQAGNNNLQLIKEIKEVLIKMIHAGLISQANAKKYLNQFI